MIERILIQHLPAFERLLRKKRSLGKQNLSDADIAEAVARMHMGLVGSVNLRVWGTMDGDDMTSVLVQEFDPRWPAEWNMSLLVLDSENVWSYTLNGLENLWAYAIAYAKEQGAVNINWSLPTVWSRSHIRTQKTSPVWQGYDIQVMRDLQVNEYPAQPFDRWIYGMRAKPYAVTIKRATPLLAT